MILIQEPHLSEGSSCSYLPDKMCRFEYFFALDLNEKELNMLLEKGWRKFGVYYFRPTCTGCRDCVPLRVVVDDYIPSKSQRRVAHNGSDVRVRYNHLNFREEIYDIYRDHSLTRFGTATEKDDFISTFYTQTCPTIQSEYYVGRDLVAVGFLDRSSEALSSVYFFYRSDYSHLSLGTLSVIREIEYARILKLRYYYLGYYISENSRMAYKNSFFPNEKFSWDDYSWIRDNGKKG